MSHEHFSCSTNNTFNLKAGKRMRRFFMLTCMAQIGAPFISRIVSSIGT